MKRAFCTFLVCGGAIAAAAETTAVADALAQGRTSLNLRLRYEGVEQTGLRDANALTFRTRLGFTTAPWQGWKAMIEAENIVAADGDGYSQSGLNPAGAGRAVVADPESTEVNQAFVTFTTGGTAFTVGRQKLILDNARFIGDVGWRQNQQTFDAAVVQDKSLAKTTLTYAYLQQVNRVFGDRHPQGKWKSDSQVMHAAYTGWPAGTITGYAYLLDFDNAAANSCATYGGSFAGSTALSGALKLLYRAEWARQTDSGSSSLNYAAHYVAVEAGLGFQPGSVVLGQEVLGGDRGVGFKTPLATLHAFNGWADLFLTTPTAGLRDAYAKATAGLPAEFALIAFYHRFELDTTGVAAGTEWDAQVSRKIGKWVTATAKVADFRRGSPAFPSVRKFWLQMEFAY